VKPGERVLILLHNDPDPDAIASGWALCRILGQRFGAEALLAYDGTVGRAENRAMLQVLGIGLHDIDDVQSEDYDAIALVDTQPGTGNNALPPGRKARMVIDHHPLRPLTSEAAYADVQPDYGATSTMLTEYLQAAELEPDARLATALLYGIQSDTLGLARGARQADRGAYLYLLPLVDTELLAQIERALVPRTYFRALSRALENTTVHGEIVICRLDRMDYPELAAEIADLLMRLQGAEWVLATGHHDGSLILSMRALQPHAGADQVIGALVKGLGAAGGHGNMAGGRIRIPGLPQKEVSRMQADLERRFLQLLDSGEEPGERLIPRRKERGE
jgi:nanoRNase/pAp phosphatase (c-di-AMP/oligoRNAs hydrolase)